jgi:hypothetical protein
MMGIMTPRQFLRLLMLVICAVLNYRFGERTMKHLRGVYFGSSFEMDEIWCFCMSI